MASLANNNGAENKDGFSLNIERLVNYLEISLAPEEKVIFEKEVKKFIARETTKEKLFEVLDASFKDGGIGLYKQAAVRLAQELSNILELSTTIHKSADRGIKNKTEYVFNWLFADYDGKISDQQKEKIKVFIHDRIKGIFSLKEFQEKLDKPTSEDGAGLNDRTARNIAQKIGLIF